MKATVAWLTFGRTPTAPELLAEAMQDPLWDHRWNGVIDASGDWHRLSLTQDDPQVAHDFMEFICRQLWRAGVHIGGREMIPATPLEQLLARDLDRLEREMFQAISGLKKTRSWMADKRIAEVRRRLEKALYPG